MGKCTNCNTGAYVSNNRSMCENCFYEMKLGILAGQKFDIGKPRYSLVPPLAISEFVAVLTFGAKKYGDHNWKLVTPLQDRYYDALQRHLVAFRSGETLDNESLKHHLAHAMCCIAFMLQADIEDQI